MLPLAYTIRNLARNPGRTAQLVIGSALVCLLVMAASALTRAMDGVLAATGSPHNVILLGAGSEESVERSEVPATVEGLAPAAIPSITHVLGRPATSTEVRYMGILSTKDGRELRARMRGVDERAMWVHQNTRLVEGHFPASGEAMVGTLAWRALGTTPDDLTPGQTLRLGDMAVRISGTFAAPGTILESEIWLDRNDLMTATLRENPSCVVVRLDSPDPTDARLFALQRSDLEIAAVTEPEYYAALSRFFRPIRHMTWLTAGLIAAAALFGGLNTLYAALVSRIRELATLQAIGFRRRHLILSMWAESTLAATAGFILAATTTLFLLHDWSVSFSTGVFRLSFGPSTLFLGLATALGVAIIGTLPPAWRCLHPPLPATLRAS